MVIRRRIAPALEWRSWQTKERKRSGLAIADIRKLRQGKAMSMPVSGLILLPLTIGIFFFSSYLAEWAIFTVVLEGAALVNVSGGFAVSVEPFFFVTALIATTLIPQWVTGKIRLLAEEPVRAEIRVLAIFVLLGVASAFVLPVLFEGLPVDSARVGVGTSYYQRRPLRWTFSNAGQAGYLVLDLLLVLRLVQVSVIPGRLERLVNALSWAGMFAAGVGVYQMACRAMSIPFPSWLFNSNEVWAELPNQLIGNGFHRVTSTFVEPSEAAAFLAAWSVFELSLAIGGAQHTRRHWLCAAAGSVVLVATISTTGYITAAVMWFAMVWDWMRTMFRRGSIKIRPALTTLGLGSAAYVALAVVPGASSLLDAVLFSKGESASAVHRTATLNRAITVFIGSRGLGVGLGSDRAMSIFFYVLSNLGLPGLILMVWALSRLYVQVRRQLATDLCDRQRRLILRALSAGFVANLFAQLVSGAEITQPTLWVLWGLLLAAIRCNWWDERPTAVIIYPMYR